MMGRPHGRPGWPKDGGLKPGQVPIDDPILVDDLDNLLDAIARCDNVPAHVADAFNRAAEHMGLDARLVREEDDQ
jgi:hypothetical protein